MSSDHEIRDPQAGAPDGRVEHPDSPYEERDLHVGPILALLIATGCVFAVTFAADLYFFYAQERSEAQEKASPYPFAANPTNPLPQPPRLDQIDRMAEQPGQSYSDQLAEMEQQLHAAAGPADEKWLVNIPKGFVHVPIERAMKEIVKQLPLRKRPPATSAGPVHAGDSNSGRMLPEAPPWSEY